VFDGSRSENSRVFLSAFEAQFPRHPDQLGTDYLKVQWAKTHMTAAPGWCNERRDDATWVEFREKFMESFIVTFDDVILRRRIGNLKQAARPVHVYRTELELLIGQLKETSNGERQHFFRSGLDENLRSFLEKNLCQGTTLESDSLRVSEYEALTNSRALRAP